MSKPNSSVSKERALLAEFLRRQEALALSAAGDPQKRVIVTKYCIYELAHDAKGIPIEEAFPKIKDWPEAMKDAKLYETEDGPVIAMPSRRGPGAGPAP